MMFVENGTMDSNTEVADSHIIMDLGNKSVRTCLIEDPVVTLQKDDNLIKENTFSNCNGNSIKDIGQSNLINGVRNCNNYEENSECSNSNGSNSSQCSLSPAQKPLSNSLSDSLSNLSIHTNLNDVPSNLSESNYKKCDKSGLNNDYSTDFKQVSHLINENEPKTDICSTDSSPDQDDIENSHSNEKEKEDNDVSEVVYICYESEKQMPDIMKLIQKDLSEPYSIYTYRYFIHNWPHLCFLAICKGKSVGAIVCKLDVHRKVIKRGYIAMLAVDEFYRKHGIGSNLVLKAIRVMAAEGADEVVLETEITNQPALRLYENLGFVRDKRLFRYYLNGVDALRLKLWLR